MPHRSNRPRPLARLAACSLACFCASIASAQDANASSRPDPLLAQAGLSEPITISAAPQGTYTNAHTWWWNATAGVASDFDDIEDANASIGFSYFAADNVEVCGDLLLRYIVQEGGDALALNPHIAFRWHFWKGSSILANTAEPSNTWTAFLEVGIGIMASTDDVPPPATSINFTPRAGAGLTYALSDTTRLLASLRWSHVSNADLFGNDDNVGSDGVMLTVGCIWAW
jgi:hypothetical protein